MASLRPILRGLFRQPSFTLAAVVTLAVGIAAPTALFSTVNAVLLRPLPYPRAADIYTVRTYFPSGRFTIGLVASEEMSALGRIASVTGIAEARRNDVAIVGDLTPRQVIAYSVSSGFFDLFGVPMTLGRGVTAADDVRGAPAVAVISHALWMSAYGGRADVVGSPITFSDRTARIVGVAPAGFDAPSGTDVWLNIWIAEGIGHGYEGYVRLTPGVTPAALTTPMTQAMEALGRKYPDQDDGRAYRLTPLLSATVGDLGPILVILLAATGLLLILAVANVSNLMLARGTGRAREIAVRVALGASRRHIIASLIGESLLLSAAGGALGIAAAVAFVRLLMRLGGARLPRLDGAVFDLRVAAFAAALVLGTGVLVGLAPALRMIGGDIAAVINETSRSVRGSRRTRRLLAGFVVAEIAIAVALVAGAARLVRSYQHLAEIDPGFDPRGRIALDVLLPSSYLSQERWNAWWDATQTTLREAGATELATSSSLPLEHEWDSTSFIDLVSRPDIPPDKRPNARLRLVSDGFFSTLGVRIVAGRAFDRTDTAQSAGVAIVNEAFARRSLTGSDPLRERIRGLKGKSVAGKFVPEEVAIVGVAGNVKYSTLAADAEPVVYVPASQFIANPRTSIVVTTPDGRPELRATQFEAAVHLVDRQIATTVLSLPAIVSRSLDRQRLGMWLMTGFGAAALLLAMVGIFGVVAYAVSEREGEMAIRQTLGATRGRVFWMVVLDSGRLAFAGLAAGGLLAWWTGRLVGRYVFEVSAGDPAILTGSAALVALVTVAATAGPAMRASTKEFARALQQK